MKPWTTKKALGAEPKPDDECENCGMIDVPLDKEGFCEGCTCTCCGSHGSMDAGGECSSVLFSYPKCCELRARLS